MEIKIDDIKLSNVFEEIIQQDSSITEKHKKLIQKYSDIINSLEEQMYSAESQLNNNDITNQNDGDYQIHL